MKTKIIIFLIILLIIAWYFIGKLIYEYNLELSKSAQEWEMLVDMPKKIMVYEYIWANPEAIVAQSEKESIDFIKAYNYFNIKGGMQ